MDRDLCKLTLVYPVEAEDRVLDVLLEAQPPLPGFASWRVEGHGASFEDKSAREKVRGSIEQNMLVMVLESARLPGVLEDLRARCAIPNLAYWVERVERFGTFR